MALEGLERHSGRATRFGGFIGDTGFLTQYRPTGRYQKIEPPVMMVFA